MKRAVWSDVYHQLLTASWTRLLALLVISYLTINSLFALGYYFDAGGLENARTHSYSDAFFFSVQTMATIGYGKMVPRSPFANTLVTIEALVGMLSMAMATGLMFAKFSRPTARVLFSKVLVISDRDGVPALVLRAANQRGNQVVEAQMRLVILRTETTKEGERIRRMIDLKLARPSTAVFALTWMAYHPITPDSPLYGETPESLQASSVDVLASIVGIDETFNQTVHARHTWFASEIVWGHRFVDVITPLPDGKAQIDYRHFHDTQPAPLTRSARG
ncbi:MAG TPA: ion channel [Kofleriaceae bacterium]|nr:ion channel [Kofleriaceae bacterium]